METTHNTKFQLSISINPSRTINPKWLPLTTLDPKVTNWRSQSIADRKWNSDKLRDLLREVWGRTTYTWTVRPSTRLPASTSVQSRIRKCSRGIKGRQTSPYGRWVDKKVLVSESINFEDRRSFQPFPYQRTETSSPPLDLSNRREIAVKGG